MSLFDFQNIEPDKVLSHFDKTKGLDLVEFLKAFSLSGTIAKYYIENYHEINLEVRGIKMKLLRINLKLSNRFVNSLH